MYVQWQVRDTPLCSGARAIAAGECAAHVTFYHIAGPALYHISRDATCCRCGRWADRIPQRQVVVGWGMDLCRLREFSGDQTDKCVGCKKEKPESDFNNHQWRKAGGQRRCKSCVEKAAAAQTDKCIGCKKEKPESDFTKHQWRKAGGQRRCKSCVAAEEQKRIAAEKAAAAQTDKCIGCKKVKPKSDFTINQWSKAGGQRRCKGCVAPQAAKPGQLFCNGDKHKRHLPREEFAINAHLNAQPLCRICAQEKLRKQRGQG
eukprot:gene56986-biopygen53635